MLLPLEFDADHGLRSVFGAEEAIILKQRLDCCVREHVLWAQGQGVFDGSLSTRLKATVPTAVPEVRKVRLPLHLLLFNANPLTLPCFAPVKVSQYMRIPPCIPTTADRQHARIAASCMHMTKDKLVRCRCAWPLRAWMLGSTC